jgi:hypothetical protein
MVHSALAVPEGPEPYVRHPHGWRILPTGSVPSVPLQRPLGDAPHHPKVPPVLRALRRTMRGMPDPSRASFIGVGPCAS